MRTPAIGYLHSDLVPLLTQGYTSLYVFLFEGILHVTSLQLFRVAYDEYKLMSINFDIELHIACDSSVVFTAIQMLPLLSFEIEVIVPSNKMPLG